MDNNGSIWFTEWTENKIGMLDEKKLKNLPIELDVSPNKIVLNSQTLDEKSLIINVTPKEVQPNNRVIMTASGSISPSGRLWNLTGDFSANEFKFDNMSNINQQTPYPVEFVLKPTKDLLPGNYTLSIGARYGDVTYSKMIELVVD
jgi:virginiamycin B lyase